MAWSRESILEFLLKAGEIALSHYDAPVVKIKADRSVVTEADQAIEQLAASYFDNESQGMYLLGEETVKDYSDAYFESGLENELFIIDPIDGTSPFSIHLGTWGISLGYAQNGLLKEGAVYLPVSGELYISAGETVYEYEVINHQLTKMSILEATFAALDDIGVVSITQHVCKNGKVNLPNVVMSVCCAVVPMVYLIKGRMMAYLGALNLWDMAGAYPLLVKLGYEGTFVSGKKLDLVIDDRFYNFSGDRPWRLREPCLFAPPNYAENLLSKIEN